MSIKGDEGVKGIKGNAESFSLCFVSLFVLLCFINDSWPRILIVPCVRRYYSSLRGHYSWPGVRFLCREQEAMVVAGPIPTFFCCSCSNLTLVEGRVLPPHGCTRAGVGNLMHRLNYWFSHNLRVWG